MEIMLLFASPDEGPPPPPCSTTKLGPNDSWSNAAALGGAGMVVDQDTDNLIRVQRGLQANKRGTVTLAAYQESRIRHFHETLEHYLTGSK